MHIYIYMYVCVYIYIYSRDQRVNQKRNNFHIKWSVFPLFIVSSERIVAIQLEQFSFLWISYSIYESHFATHLHAVNLCFKVLSFPLIVIIYGSLQKALSGSAPGSSPATGQFSKLLFKPWPSARMGAVSLLAKRLRNALQWEQQYLELGVLDSKPAVPSR